MSNDTDGLNDGRPQGSSDFSVRRWVVAPLLSTPTFNLLVLLLDFY